MSFRLSACALLLTASALTAQGTAAPQAAPATPPANAATANAATTISVSARLVVVPVTVREKKGALVPNLHKEDFALSEDGTAQTIRYFDHDNNAPLTLGLLVDVSGSQRTVLDDERTASSAFLDTLLQPDRDKAFVVQFGHQADMLADVTTSLPKLQAGLKKIDADTDRPQFNGGGGNGGSTSGGSGNSGSNDPADDPQSNDPQGNRGGGGSGRSGRGGRGGANGAGTVMYDAIFLASDEVIGKQQNRKALILLTDGDDRGSKESIGSAIEAAQRADTAVYAIYYKGESPRGGGFGNGGGGGRAAASPAGVAAFQVAAVATPAAAARGGGGGANPAWMAKRSWNASPTKPAAASLPSAKKNRSPTSTSRSRKNCAPSTASVSAPPTTATATTRSSWTCRKTRKAPSRRARATTPAQRASYRSASTAACTARQISPREAARDASVACGHAPTITTTRSRRGSTHTDCPKIPSAA